MSTTQNMGNKVVPDMRPVFACLMATKQLQSE